MWGSGSRAHGVQRLRQAGTVVGARGLWSVGSAAVATGSLALRHMAPPRPGREPVGPALAGGVPAPVPRGAPRTFLKSRFVCVGSPRTAQLPLLCRGPHRAAVKASAGSCSLAPSLDRGRLGLQALSHREPWAGGCTSSLAVAGGHPLALTLAGLSRRAPYFTRACKQDEECQQGRSHRLCEPQLERGRLSLSPTSLH